MIGTHLKEYLEKIYVGKQMDNKEDEQRSRIINAGMKAFSGKFTKGNELAKLSNSRKKLDVWQACIRKDYCPVDEIIEIAQKAKIDGEKAIRLECAKILMNYVAPRLTPIQFNVEEQKKLVINMFDNKSAYPVDGGKK